MGLEVSAETHVSFFWPKVYYFYCLVLFLLLSIILAPRHEYNETDNV